MTFSLHMRPRGTRHAALHYRAWIFAAALAGLASGAFADQGAKGATRQHLPSVTPDAAFSKPATEDLASPEMLRAFLTELRQTRHRQSFCFVQEVFPPSNADSQGSAVVWMEWITGSRLYRLRARATQPSGAPSATQDDDAASRGTGLANGKSVNLKADVVADEAAVGSSTYLVTRAWVNRIRDQCRLIGTVVRLPAFRPSNP